MTDSHNNFAAKLKELEAITAWFESEQVDLNEALAKFERGMELSDQLKKELQDVENRVEKIKQKFDSSTVEAAEPEPANGGSEHPDLFSN
jgi:exodeoxyribonuclease VII small subunit